MSTPYAAEVVADGGLNIDEAAQFACISRAELYRLMERGELDFVKYGRRRIVPKNAIRALLARHLVMRGSAETAK